jgi:hypothetical protein
MAGMNESENHSWINHREHKEHREKAKEQPDDLIIQVNRHRNEVPRRTRCSSSLYCNTSNSIIFEKIFLAAKNAKNAKKRSLEIFVLSAFFVARSFGCGGAALGSLTSAATRLIDFPNGG